MGTALFSVSADTLAAIVARPEKFLAAYSGLGGGTPAAFVRSQLAAAFSSLTDAGCVATFASVVAYKATTAGITTLDASTATMHDLLTAPALASQHLCRLNALLALLASPGLVPPELPAASPAKATVHFLTWLDTVPLNTGAHAQLVITNVLDSAYLLLDPQYAYAVRIPFVGAGPQSSLPLAQNVASMLQTPLAADNLAILDPTPTSAVPQMLQALQSGALGPEYLDNGATSGADFWDANLAQVVYDMN
jgi:hypothetical protein